MLLPVEKAGRGEHTRLGGLARSPPALQVSDLWLFLRHLECVLIFRRFCSLLCALTPDALLAHSSTHNSLSLPRSLSFSRRFFFLSLFGSQRTSVSSSSSHVFSFDLVHLCTSSCSTPSLSTFNDHSPHQDSAQHLLAHVRCPPRSIANRAASGWAGTVLDPTRHALPLATSSHDHLRPRIRSDSDAGSTRTVTSALAVTITSKHHHSRCDWLLRDTTIII